MVAFYRWVRFAEVDECLPALGDDDLVAEVYEEMRSWEASRLAGVSPRGVDRIRGALALRLDETGQAEEWFRKGLEWAESERCPVEQGRCLQGLSEVAERRGQGAEALAHIEAAAALFEQHGAALHLEQSRTRQETLVATPGS